MQVVTLSVVERKVGGEGLPYFFRSNPDPHVRLLLDSPKQEQTAWMCEARQDFRKTRTLGLGQAVEATDIQADIKGIVQSVETRNISKLKVHANASPMGFPVRQINRF